MNLKETKYETSLTNQDIVYHLMQLYKQRIKSIKEIESIYVSRRISRKDAQRLYLVAFDSNTEMIESLHNELKRRRELIRQGKGEEDSYPAFVNHYCSKGEDLNES